MPPRKPPHSIPDSPARQASRTRSPSLSFQPAGPRPLFSPCHSDQGEESALRRQRPSSALSARERRQSFPYNFLFMDSARISTLLEPYLLEPLTPAQFERISTY